jgi:IS66 C-terminal element
MNDIDPQAWLADLLARIVDHLAARLNELLGSGKHCRRPHCRLTSTRG